MSRPTLQQLGFLYLFDKNAVEDFYYHEQGVFNICGLFYIVCDEETGADCIGILCADVLSGIGIFD